MNKIIKYLVLCILIVMNIVIYASSEPPSPGGDPSGSGDPIGGGAPIGEGNYILIAFGLIYVVYKSYRFNTKPKETTISSTTMIK